MLSLISLFWRLTIFRVGPSEVPPASALLPVMTVVFVVVNMAVRLWLAYYDAWYALLSSALIMLVWAVAIYALLAFKNVRERFLQSFVALWGWIRCSPC